LLTNDFVSLGRGGVYEWKESRELIEYFKILFDILENSNNNMIDDHIILQIHSFIKKPFNHTLIDFKNIFYSVRDLKEKNKSSSPFRNPQSRHTP